MFRAICAPGHALSCIKMKNSPSIYIKYQETVVKCCYLSKPIGSNFSGN